MNGPLAPVIAAVEAARAGGRDLLYETEALTVAACLGVGIPSHLVVPGPGDVARFDLSVLLGDRVVVKAMAPGLAHKTEAGAVVEAAKDGAAISSAIASMAERVPEAQAFLVAEHVAHEPGPGGEVLLGMRWTDAFGPVATFGFGGTSAEFLAALAPAAVFSPALRAGIGPALDACAAAAPVTGGVRGRPPAMERPALERLVGAALDAAARLMPHHLVEFEINPLALTPRGPMALDALGRIGPPPEAAARPDLRPGAVAGMLAPETIGVIGVSERVNLGRVILRNVLAAGFPPERVVVVKPGADEIDGVRCVPDLEAMGQVGLLVVAVGADAVPDIVEGVAAAGLASGVILVPGGLGERAGTEGHAGRIAAALAAAPHPRPVVNGGNCMGIRSVPGGYDTTFIPAHKTAPQGREGRHPVAVVSQSGAFAIARHDRLPWLDPAYVITVGNQVDLTVGDYLDHLADDPAVQVAACYVEGFRPGDGLRWAGAAARMRERGGRVILYLGGRTAAGAAAAASHTAAVAGDAVVAAGLARAAGALVAGSLDEFEDLLRAAVLLADRPFGGRRLGAVTNAGFEAVAVADALGTLQAARLAPATLERIDAILAGERLGGVVAAGNPLDLTPNCRAEAYAAAAAAVLGDPGVDVGLVGCVPLTPSLATLAAGEGHDEDTAAADSLASLLGGLWAETTLPWAAVVDGGAPYDPMAGVLEAAGIPVFRAADRALRALGALAAG
ncbi:MAG: acetate--CoA ligase family protein [Actinobacteria bacterium]|nr:acetate--CoA ligase family protein [Actinomycetota bacterium]